MSNVRRTHILFLFLWLVGVVDSLYLLLYGASSSNICSIGSGCHTFRYKQLFAALGLVWFLLAIPSLKNSKLRMFWQVSGVVGVIVLVGIEFLTRSFCMFCTVAHGVGLAMIVLSLFGMQDVSKPTDHRSSENNSRELQH